MIARAVALVLFGVWLAGATSQAPAPVRSFHVVGYFADWTAARYPVAGIPASRLTHINYAFGKIDADNRITVGDTLFPQIAALKEKNPHLKVILSVGGWTDSGPFYEMAATDAGRQTFAQSSAAFLERHRMFDGIDIDWEHPVVGGLQKVGQPRDARNYVDLLAAIRRAIGSGKLLTIAVGAGPRAIEPLDYAGMAASLDWVSVMTYDFHTGGARTGFNAALYNHDDPSDPRLNLHDAVQAILAKGVPRSKLVAGAPFYGRGWRGVESSGVGSTGTGTLQQVGGYKAIASTYLTAPGFVRYWDDVAKVPWLYNAATKEWISYEDAQSMRLKGEYIAAQNLGGGMFWELSHDDNTLLDALRAGLGLATK